jgi:hypothetical protein
MRKTLILLASLIVALSSPLSAGTGFDPLLGRIVTVPPASRLSYSTSTSGLSEANVQGAIDELATMIADVTTGGLSDIDQLPGDTTDDDKIDLGLLTTTPSFESMTLTGAEGLTLGVAGTTQGALVIASNTHAVYKNTIVPGTMTESVSWRLPGAMPAGADYLVNCDVTTGQMGYTNPATFQAADADLTTWAGVTPSANGQSLVSAANYAAMRGLLDLEAGTDFNAYDYDLGTLASGITGIVKGGGNGGGFSAASAGTDYLAPTGSASQLTGYSTGAQPLDSDLTALAGISGQRGDIIYYGSGGWTMLGKGTENYVLTQGANDPAWAAATGGGASTLDDLTDVTITSGAQGDIFYNNGSAIVNLGPGDSGKFLQTKGAGANPEWASVPGGGDMLASAYPFIVALEALTTADASLVQLTGTDTAAVLTSGGNNYILGSNSDNSALEFKTPANVLSQIGAQAADADLTTYAGITPAANTQTFLGSANYAAMRTNMGVAIGSDVQAYDADLTTYAGITPSANIQTLLGSADYSAARTNLGLAIGTNVQAYDADLTSVAGGITGLVLGAGNGGGYSAATAGTDYPGLASANTFTGNNTFGNADTDTLTLRSLLAGGNSRAVWIAGSAPTPTYATGTNELYVAGDIETAGNVYAKQFIGAATGDSYIQLANNSGGLSGSGYRLWFETDTTDQLKYSINGTEKAVVNVEDAQTISGAKTLSSALTINRGSTGAGQLIISEDSDDGTNAVTITGQAMSASYTLTLPADDGTNGQALVTNGSGVTSWGTVSATAGGSDTQVQFNDGGSALGGDAGFVFNKTTDTLTLGENSVDGVIVLYNESGATDYNLTIQPGTQSGAATITMPGSTATLATLGLAETLSGAKTFSANVTLDDGTGASPSFTFQDATDETAVFSKADAGYLTVTTVAGDGFGVLVGNLTVGNGSPGQTLNGEDAYIEGLLEVDGIAYLDGGVTFGTALVPASADALNIGSATAEVANLYLGDSAVIYGQNDQSNTLTSSATGWTMNLDLTISGGNINFGNIAGVLGDAATDSITLTTDGTGNGEVVLPNDAIGDAEIDWGSGAGQIDLADIPGGAAGASAFDFGGATSVEIPNSDDPDVDATGEVSLDTDGWLRVYQNSLQKAIPLQEEIHVTVVAPNDLADATRDAFQAWENVSGMSFIVTGWSAASGTDDTDLNIEETDADGQNNATVDAVSIATNGTGIFTASDTTITGATIENGHRLLLDFDDTDAPTWVKITIYGYYAADVN